MKHSETIAALAVALVAAQKEIKAVPKESVNPHFRSKFASLDAITDAVKPALHKNGLAVVQGATTPISDANGRLTAIALETMLIHTSGEWISNTVVLPVGTVPVKDREGNVIGAEPTAQTAGATTTYGRRYGLAAFFAITNDEDDDGNEASERSGVSKAATMKASPAPREGAASEQTGGQTRSPADKLMPFGKTRGKRLGDLNYGELDSAREWCEKTDATKFASLIMDIGIVLASRNERPVASAVGVGAGFDDFPSALQETDDDLPF